MAHKLQFRLPGRAPLGSVMGWVVLSLVTAVGFTFPGLARQPVAAFPASGRFCLPRFLAFIFLIFLMLSGFALPQQAAAQAQNSNSIVFMNSTIIIADATGIEGGTARFLVTVNPALRFHEDYSVEYVAGTAELDDLGSSRPTYLHIHGYEVEGAERVYLEVPINDDQAEENEETFTVEVRFQEVGSIQATGTIIDNDGPPPDLIVDNVSTSSSTPEADATFIINATVRNSGDGPSPATTLSYYRSADSTITTADSQLATDAVGGLAPGATSSASATVSIANAGNYWVGACVAEVNNESATDNNCSSGVPVTVTARPDSNDGILPAIIQLLLLP